MTSLAAVACVMDVWVHALAPLASLSERSALGVEVLPWAGLGVASLVVLRQESLRETAEDSERSAESREALERYHLLAESISDVVLFATTTGRIVDCNRAAEIAYGYSREQMLERSLADLAADPDEVVAPMRDAELESVRFDTVQQRSDGSVFEAESVLQEAVLGGTRLLVNTVRDVSGRRATERALVESERRYRCLVEMSPYGIAVYQDDRVVFVNGALLQLAHVDDPSRILGMHPLDLVHPDSLADVAARQLQMAQTGQPVTHIQELLMRPDGSTLEAEVSAVPITFDGRPAVQVIVTDVTERKALDRALATSTQNAIAAMARLAEVRDPYTAGHQERVAWLARAIAEELELPADAADAIELAGRVHDIGKMHVPIEILTKPGGLAPAEMELVRTHPRHGAVVLEPIGFTNSIPQMVLQHHERLDGSGYPQGLAGDEILLGSRIIAVADVLEAAASRRPYRPALGVERALAILREGRGPLFDAEVVDACERVVARTPGLFLEEVEV